MQFNFAFLGNNDLKFSDLRDSWSVGVPKFIGGSDPGLTNIRLSNFRGARFRDDTLRSFDNLTKQMTGPVDNNNLVEEMSPIINNI